MKEFIKNLLVVVSIAFGGILLLCLGAAINPVYGQSAVLNGKTFIQQSRIASSRDTLVTEYSYQDSRGTVYPIVINKNSGRCYIWKVSSKSGKSYKMYLPKDVSKEVSDRLDIAYAEKKPKNQ